MIFGAVLRLHDKPLTCTFGRDGGIRTRGLLLPKARPIVGRVLVMLVESDRADRASNMDRPYSGCLPGAFRGSQRPKSASDVDTRRERGGNMSPPVR